MSNIEWLGSAAPSGVGAVRLRTPGPGMLPSSTNIFNRFDNSLFQFTPPQPQLRVPPGQWSFAISVGGRLIGTCGPVRMDTRYSQYTASVLYERIVPGHSRLPLAILPGTIFGPVVDVGNCPNVTSRARDAYQRGQGAVTIAASRNGVFQFNWSSGSIQPNLAGVSEDDGTLGQISTFEECFANPDCDQCWREQFRNAQIECNPGSDDYDECVNELARQFTRDRCFPNFGGTGTRINAYPWQIYSDETCLHQDQVNAVLIANGYQAIARDCRTGPRTCGASSVATQIDPSVGIPDTCFAHQSEWVLPARATQPPPVEVPPVVTPVPTTAKAGVGAGGLALLAAAVLGGIYLVTQVA